MAKDKKVQGALALTLVHVDFTRALLEASINRLGEAYKEAPDRHEPASTIYEVRYKVEQAAELLDIVSGRITKELRDDEQEWPDGLEP